MASQGKLFNIATTLPAEASSETDVINMAKFCLLGIGVTGNPVATALTFEVGHEEASIYPLYDQDGVLFTVTFNATPEGVYTLNANDFAGFEYIKIVSGATEVAPITLRLFGYYV